MLGDCEKMVVISSSSATSGEWTPHPQNQNNQVDREKVLGMMDSSSSGVLMENPNQEQQKQQQLQQQQQQQQQQVPLKCPRCDSANTKFCYYNNYSLSQPRHFCKACKRYWTRGGTLRNVPVGGGCRKNKRIKRPNSTSTSHEATSSSSSAQMATSNPSCTTTATATTNNIVHPHHQLDLSSSASHMNPLFYGLFANSSQHHLSPDLGNLGYPRFGNDHSQLHQASQMGDLGLGFSSGIPGGGADGGQDLMPSNMSLLSGNYSHPIFGSMSSSSTTSTIGSLLASTLQRQKFGLGGGGGGGLGLKDAPPQGNSNGFHGFDPYEEIQMGKDHVKMEDNQNSTRMEWGGQIHHHHGSNGQNHMEQINSSSHDQSLMWNSTGVGGGAWLDPPNLGSSVPSLI